MGKHLLNTLSGVALLFLIARYGAAASEIDSLLQIVREGNQSAVDSIRTFYCRVKVTHKPEGPLPQPSGEYWRSPEATRAKWRLGSRVLDSLLRGSQVRTLSEDQTAGKGVTRTGTIDVYNGMPLGFCDPWALGLLIIPSPQSGVGLPFDELLKRPHRLKRVMREPGEGHDFVTVELEHALSHLEIRFDSQSNYLVSRLVQSWTEEGVQPVTKRVESVVTQFKEVVPGLFFPERIESKTYRNGELRGVQVAVFSGILINKPLSENAFKVAFPPGTKVADAINGKQYIASPNGLPAGSVTDLPIVRPLPASIPGKTETREEPRPWTRWLFPASLGILGMGGGLWLLRKWRKGSGA